MTQQVSQQAYRTITPLATALPMAYQASPKEYKYVHAAKLHIDNLMPGDTLAVTSSDEASTASTAYPHSVMFGHFTTANGIQITRPMGTNIVVGEHHCVLSAGGFYVCPDNKPVDLVLVMYAASLTGPVNSDSLVLNYVDLQALVTRFREV